MDFQLTINTEDQVMMIGYLTLAESLNDQIRTKKLNAKIYCWQHRYERKLHGVEIYINGKMEDIAVNVSRRQMKAAVQQAYNTIVERLSV